MNDDIKKALMIGLAFAVAAAILLGFSGCGREPEKKYCDWYDYFDTQCSLLAYPEDDGFEDAMAIAEEQLVLYDQLCDIYDLSDEYVNACELNARAGQGPIEVSRELFNVLKFGKDMYSYTGGETNIAFGAVLSIWHNVREDVLHGVAPYLPDDEALKEAAKHCNIDNLILDEANLTVELADPEMSLDLGAITKGYVADVITEKLSDAGYTGYIVNLGGNVKANGEKMKGEPWITGIASPNTESEGSYVRMVKLTNESLVTSGSYQRYFEYDGERYHHIISPKTLYPKNDFLSVTILAESSALADALSTAVYNMDYEDGLSFIEGLEGIEAAWIFPDYGIEFSSGFEKYIKHPER